MMSIYDFKQVRLFCRVRIWCMGFRWRVMRNGICDGVCCTQKPCLPSRLLHLTSANIVPPTPSGFSAPRSQSSAGLAAPCFCVQKVQTQIPEHICPKNIRQPLSGIVQPRSAEILHHCFSVSEQHPPISQTAFYAHMPFEPPACERGHDTDYGKSRERN